MSAITMDDDHLKALLKQALLELFEEKSKVVEMIGLVKAIIEGEARTAGPKRNFAVMKFGDYPKAGSEHYDRGVLTVTLPSWNDFSVTVQKLKNHKDFIWRGQRCETWRLISKFDRLSSQSDRREREHRLGDHLQRFRFSIQVRRGSNPSRLSDKECWALGQHFGLVTPLLDWTESPFVATYFAFIGKGFQGLSEELMRLLDEGLSPPVKEKLKKELKDNSQTEYRIVYALNRDLVRWGVAESKDGPMKERSVEFADVMSDENPRLVSQSGLFTISLDVDIRERVQRCYGRNPNEERIILMETRIPNKDREECLKSLNQMNINHLSLFPDLYGSAKYSNVRLEIEDY